MVRKQRAQKCSRGNTNPLSTEKSRWHAFTSYLKTEPLWNEKTMKWLAYGDEICPTTKRHHWQGFICWKDAKTEPASGKALENAHSEIMLGSIEQNEKYCSKEGKYKTFGKKPRQGERTDLIELVDKITTGETTAEKVAIENPMYYHMYGRTLEKAEDVTMREIFRTFMTEGIWYVGNAGIGKSHAAFENFNPKTHYLYRQDNGWWDGYRQQETVIINDFRGEIKYAELLQIIDKWPYYVRRRCREPMPFMSKKVIITSTLRPEEVYRNLHHKDGIEQLLRRVKVVELTKVNK